MEQHRHNKRNRGCTGIVSSFAPLVAHVKNRLATRISRVKIKQIKKNRNKRENKQNIKQRKTKQKTTQKPEPQTGKYFQHS